MCASARGRLPARSSQVSRAVNESVALFCPPVSVSPTVKPNIEFVGSNKLPRKSYYCPVVAGQRNVEERKEKRLDSRGSFHRVIEGKGCFMSHRESLTIRILRKKNELRVETSQRDLDRKKSESEQKEKGERKKHPAASRLTS